MVFSFAVVSTPPQNNISCPSSRGGTIAEFRRLLESEARENFSKLVECKKIKPGEFETIISSGLSPGEMIAKEAKKHKADMIVVASHGRSGLQRLFLGSVAERTLRRADRPMLLMK